MGYPAHTMCWVISIIWQVFYYLPKRYLLVFCRKDLSAFLSSQNLSYIDLTFSLNVLFRSSIHWNALSTLLPKEDNILVFIVYAIASKSTHINWFMYWNKLSILGITSPLSKTSKRLQKSVKKCQRIWIPEVYELWDLLKLLPQNNIQHRWSCWWSCLLNSMWWWWLSNWMLKTKVAPNI